MKTLTIKAYEFSELSPKAKEVARQWYREGQYGDTSWSEFTIEEAVREGELMGIEFKPRNQKWHNVSTGKEGIDTSPSIFFSGFSSQGDGACFEGTWRAANVKADKVADGWGDADTTTEIKRIAAKFDRIAKAYPEASFTVTHRGYYYHEHCTEFDFQFPDGNDGEDWPEAQRELWQAECDALKENVKDFMRWIYRQLNTEWDDRNSDEQVDETIEANEYLFTEEGKRCAVLNQ